MKRFDDLSLPEELQAALSRIGFIEPTPIQQKAIPAMLEGRDLMACAATGSGKTGAYLIPMLATLLQDQKAQGLVLVPTRELAMQISDFLRTIVPNKQTFNTACLVGGQDIRRQFKQLQRKPRVIIATPGRMIDHLKRNTIQIHKVNQLVLDEGDRMIDMGFAPQLQQILKHLPPEKQASFFTATLDEKVKSLAKQYLQRPVLVFLNDSKPVAKIKQSVLSVPFFEKDDRVVDELNERQGSVIIFVKTKHRTDKLTKHLIDFGFAAGAIHGGKTQGQRNKAIDAFRTGKVRILCATDVAARGIDVPHVEHVLNFDLPMQDEDYVHRIGRTARNGAEGEALSFVMPEEYSDWNRIAKKYDIPGPAFEVQGRGGNSKFKGRGKGKPSFGRKPSFKAKFRKNSDESFEDRPRRKRFEDSDRPKRFGKKERFEDRPSRDRFGDSDRPKSFGRKDRFEDQDRPRSFKKDRFDDRPQRDRSDSSDRPKRFAKKDRFEDRPSRGGRSGDSSRSEFKPGRGGGKKASGSSGKPRRSNNDDSWGRKSERRDGAPSRKKSASGGGGKGRPLKVKSGFGKKKSFGRSRPSQ